MQDFEKIHYNFISVGDIIKIDENSYIPVDGIILESD
jgi:magnesium-transporting ATPase (P-type)